MTQDRIELKGMVFYGFHGVDQAEREVGQRFTVDLKVARDLRPAGLSDDICDTVSYADLYRVVKKVVEGPSCRLLENLAETIAQRVLENFEINAVSVAVRKPEAPIKGSVLSYAGVEIVRQKK